MRHMTSSARQWYAAISPEWGRWVVSWKIWAALAISRVVLAVVLISTRYDMQAPRSALLVLVAYSLAGLVMALASATVLRHRLTVPPRPAVVISVWFVAGLTYSSTLYLTLPLSDRVPTGGLVSLIVVPAFLFVLKVGAAVAIVSLIAAGARQSRALRTTIARQQDLVLRSEAYIAELGQRNLDALATLQPAFSRLHAEVRPHLQLSVDHSLGDLPERISSFGQGEVRQLSHRVAAGDFGSSLQPTEPPHHPRPTAAQVLRDSLNFAPYALFTAGWFLLLVTAWSTTVSAEQLRLTMAECAVIVLELTITRLTLARMPENMVATRISVVLVTCAAAIAAVMLIHTAAVGSEFSVITLIEVSLALIGSVLLTGTYRQQKAVLAELTAAEALLNSQINDLRRSAERIRHRIAQLLHGTIQGRLALASLRLTELRTLTDPAAAAHSRTEILALLASIEAEFHAAEHDIPFTPAAGAPTLDETLAEIARDWAGLLHYTSAVHPDASEVLRTRPRLAREVGDIITEAVVNARRHGDASTVTSDVTIATSTPLNLRITVTDDGHGPAAITNPGLGHATLASLGARWALLRDEHDHTVLVVILHVPTETPPTPSELETMAIQAPTGRHAVITEGGVTHRMERIGL